MSFILPCSAPRKYTEGERLSLALETRWTTLTYKNSSYCMYSLQGISTCSVRFQHVVPVSSPQQDFSNGLAWVHDEECLGRRDSIRTSFAYGMFLHLRIACRIDSSCSSLILPLLFRRRLLCIFQRPPHSPPNPCTFDACPCPLHGQNVPRLLAVVGT